jgi:hypothetical protein
MKPIFILFLPKRIGRSSIEAERINWRFFQFNRFIRLIRRCLREMVLTGLAISYSGASTAEGFLPDNREILMMPQMCQWWYGPRVGMDPALMPKGPPFDMSGCTRFHYFCDAHTNLVRSEKNTYTNPGKAKYQLDSAIATLKGQVKYRKAEPGCSKNLLADTHYSLGKALERYARLTKSSSYSAQAIGPLLETIELTPEDIRPYQMLGDIYIALKKPQQAEEIIYRGLQVNPESKQLLRRYKDVGGKRPLPTTKPAAPNEERSSGDTQNQVTGPESSNTIEVIPPASADPKTPQGNSVFAGAVQSEETRSEQNKATSTRDCRFCSNDDVSKDKISPAPVQPKSTNQSADKPSCRFCP